MGADGDVRESTAESAGRLRPDLVATGIGLAAVAVATGALLAELVTHGGNDFEAYYFAAHRVIEGQPLFSAAATDVAGAAARGRITPWVYLPVYTVLFVPLTPLRFEAALFAWTAGSFVALWLSVLVLARELGYRLTGRRLVGSWIALLVYPPVVWGLTLGQVTLVMTALLTLGVVRLLRSRTRDDESESSGVARATGGAFVATTVLLKPFYAPAAADVVHDRARLVGAAAGGAAIAGLSVALFGPAPHREYLAVLAVGNGWGLGREFVQWFPSWYEPLSVVGPAQHGVRAVLGVVTAAVGIRAVGGGERAVRSTAALGLVSVALVAPNTHTLEFIPFLPAALLLDSVTDRRRLIVAALGFAGAQLFLPPVIAGALGSGFDEGVTGTARVVVAVAQPGAWANLVLWVLAIRATAASAPSGGVRAGMARLLRH